RGFVLELVTMLRRERVMYRIDDIYRKEEGLPTLSLGVKWRKLFAATVLEVPALVFILGDLW
ncbi:9624_t:CDS:2, partial [Funneliformis geosporum]